MGRWQRDSDTGRKVIPRPLETQSSKARQVTRRDNGAVVGMNRQETPTLWSPLGSRVSTERGPRGPRSKYTHRDPQTQARPSRKWFQWEAELKAVFCGLLRIC